MQSLVSQHGLLVVRHHAYITAQRYGPVRIAVVWPFGARELWFVVSDEPCRWHTFAAYHGRTGIEEGFLDLKRAAFNLEDTRLGQARLTRALAAGLSAAAWRTLAALKPCFGESEGTAPAVAL